MPTEAETHPTMTSRNHRLGTLILTLSLVGCDQAENQCVADCNGSSTSEGGTATSTDPPAAAACEAAVAAIDAFAQDNRACETAADCTAVRGLCGPGVTCGSVGIAVGAEVRSSLRDAVDEACGCEAPTPCAAEVTCNAAGQCEAVDVGACEEVLQDVEEYLQAHRSCEVDQDCQLLPSNCFLHDCGGSVAANLDATTSEWETLDQKLLSCDWSRSEVAYCGVIEDCAFSAVCSDEGQCVSQR